MPGGYMGKILRVNLSTGELKIEHPDESLYKDYIGGYGIGARILYSEMKPGADPLGPDNILGFATGPLTGTPALLGSRYTVFAKSPLTGGWGDANSGGQFGPGMKFAGFDAILVAGVSSHPVYLLVDSGQASLEDAGHLWRKDCTETEDALRGVFGEEAQVSCIGPSGEKQSLISCIMNNKGRAAGRSGLGAVMGSKKLKAVVVRGKISVPLADIAGLNQLRKEATSVLSGPFYDRIKHYGTAGGTSTAILRDDAPARNWGAVAPIAFASGVEKHHGDVILDKQAKKYGCWRCPIACGGILKAVEGDYQVEAGTHKPEYETVAGFGSMCLNDNLDSIIVANDICNRSGLDTISAGATIAFAMECYEHGLISKDDTGGIELTWGNDRAMIAMLKNMAQREGFGAVLADGVKRASEKIGNGADVFAIHVGGQEPAMHDPRVLTTTFPAYQVDATPGRHTQKDDSRHVCNAAGLCSFGEMIGNSPFMARYLALATGWERSTEELLIIGERIHNLRHAFNLREGINCKDRVVPGRIVGRPPKTEGPLAGVSIDVEGELAAYVAKKGWDPATFKPTREKLLELGLEDVAADLWP